MAMTIDEVKKKKIELESALTKLLKEFEEETGVRTNYFNIERKRPKNEPEIARPIAESDDGPIINTEVDLRFDI